ncbi:Rsm22-domain-containing protein [Dacryopinax primogenitus]|uniref:Rsm22-domain-containing protein n=1 Tax=Dacryopinax primogenitus (strain DJM 731) TaxID=1858805 RepID=M5FWH4_DACPD|nr:Rsm22-domain-containing protein [Dacryopinax primogenitus]EJU00040.1 Rsm22-domain-containing protein [Dacryopinax primogenitus]
MYCVRWVNLLRVPLVRSVQNAPNPPLNLDPSYEELLATDLSTLRRRKFPKRVIPELEHSPLPHPNDEAHMDLDGKALEAEEDEDIEYEGREERRSIAAVYGSKRIGAVEMPFQLVSQISMMISGLDKHALRSDAKRLYFHPSNNRWHATPLSATKTRQGDRDARNGIAHISVGLPAQYSVVENVLKEVRHRIGPREELGLEGWMPTQVVDFSAGVGAALWASLKVFQGKDAPDDSEASLPHSTLKKYIAVNPNEGWRKLAEELQNGESTLDIHVGETEVTYLEKLQQDTVHPDTLPNTLAISAFTLSQMTSENNRRAFIKAFWATGAEVMVLIDRGTKEGFTHIANARRRLLRYGKHEALVAEFGADVYPSEPLEAITIGGSTFVEEVPNRLPPGVKLDDIPGLAHVVAPCPHDGPCPLHEALLEGGKDFCHFSQRLQRPEFVRLTKHSNYGEEDTPYSYVVIRRGRRPTLDADSERRGTGRLGGVGKEMVLHERAKRAEEATVFHEGDELVIGMPQEEEAMSRIMHADHEAIRIESYEWPRIVYPPLKRSGHIVFDMCTQSGNIERHTIPKSQGKQPYYDARKAMWGDAFPHHPKIPPIVRERGIKRLIRMRKEERENRRIEREQQKQWKNEQRKAAL